MLPPSQFSYRRSLGTSDVLLTVSHRLQVTLARSMEGRVGKLIFSAAFDTVRYCGLLYKLISIGVRG